MTTKEIVDEIMACPDAPCFAELCHRLGVNSNTFANQVKRGVKTVRLFSRIVKVLGYRIVVVPERTESESDWFDVD